MPATLYVLTSTAHTAAASKYLQQLCKHFAHKVPAEWTTHSGTVDFPFGLCTMEADDNRLSIRCQTPDEANIPRLKGVVDAHIERFAWREKLRLDWELHQHEKHL